MRHFNIRRLFGTKLLCKLVPLELESEFYGTFCGLDLHDLAISIC